MTCYHGRVNGEDLMEPDQAKRLGNRLQKQRDALELSTRELAKRAGVPQSTVVRLEQGLFLSPRAEKLAAIADALGLDPTAILKLAKYPSLTAMPAPRTYLRAKYRDLNSDQIEALHRDVQRVLEKHGINPSGPEPGEDEEPEPRTSTKPKKGGKKS
jgi:transcriptional regulator with XRE-family HTH domain